MQLLQLQKQAKFYHNKSQSIIEIFLSILIFSIAFIGFLILVSSYLNALKNAKERIIANFLTQEGLELVIAKRNINFVKEGLSQRWLEGLVGNSYVSSITICLDYNLEVRNNCDLYIDDEGRFTHQPTNTTTIFSREIILSSLDNLALQNSTSVEVISIVRWPNNSVELSTIITKWHPLIH